MAPRPERYRGLLNNPLRSRQPRDTRHARQANDEGGFRWRRLRREAVEDQRVNVRWLAIILGVIDEQFDRRIEFEKGFEIWIAPGDEQSPDLPLNWKVCKRHIIDGQRVVRCPDAGRDSATTEFREIETISESRVTQKTNGSGDDFLIRPLHTQTHVGRLSVVSNLQVRLVCKWAGSYRPYLKCGNTNVVGALEDRNAFDGSGNILKSHAVRNQVNTRIAAQGGKTRFEIGRRKPADQFESFRAIRRKWKRRFARCVHNSKLGGRTFGQKGPGFFRGMFPARVAVGRARVHRRRCVEDDGNPPHFAVACPDLRPADGQSDQQRDRYCKQDRNDPLEPFPKRTRKLFSEHTLPQDDRADEHTVRIKL